MSADVSLNEGIMDLFVNARRIVIDGRVIKSNRTEPMSEPTELDLLRELEASLRDVDDYPAARGLTQRTCIALAHLWGMRDPAR